MNAETRDLTLGRRNRLVQAVGDLMESHAAQGRIMNRAFDAIGDTPDRIGGGLQALTKADRDMASEQILLGGRVEEALARAFRSSLRLDNIERARL